jgi:shikimate dehydrogenase
VNGVMRLAVLGDPLVYTRSPDLHRAGLASLGLACESQAIRTSRAELGDRLSALGARGLHGVNLTHPLKQAALEYLTRASDDAMRARSVNTVGFGRGEIWGDTTDGAGFLDLLRSLSREPAAQHTVLLGAGGAARSLAAALEHAGAPPATVSARDPEAARAAFDQVSASVVAWRSKAENDALANASVVVNATPLSAPEEIVPLSSVPNSALIVDLVYGPELTPLTIAARRARLEAFDGLGLLVFQARLSLALWTGREVEVAPMMQAVGWPR